MTARNERPPIGGLGAILAAGLWLGATGFALDDEGEEPKPEPKTKWEYLTQRYDANGDGRITRKEYTRDREHWERLDVDGDGFLTQEEIEGRRRPKGSLQGKTPKAPEVGDKAPGFKLEVVPPPEPESELEAPTKGKKKDKKEYVKLSSFKGKKPVALIFGSYT